jgi:hypothetical protein
MSHFSVLVITEQAPPAFEEALAPFQENNMGDCPKQYLAFNEVDDDDYDVDPETGKRGYWENPNAKWDWFVLGGRFSDLLQVKDPSLAMVGRPGLMGSRASATGFDASTVGNLNMPAMHTAAEQRRARHWDECEATFARPFGLSYTEALAESTAGIEACRKLRKEDETLRSVIERNPRLAKIVDAVFNASPFNEPDAPDRASYIAAANGLQPFAILKDGQWHERGEMGWWGIVTGEKDPLIWRNQVNELIAGLNPDHWVAIVDCHI